MKSADQQREMWLITINNPEAHGVTHEGIHNTLQNEFPTIQYYAMCDEKGSCYHIHCVVCFTSRVRFSTIKKKECFSKAHLDAVNGTLSECVTYLKKGGKWLENQDKQDQKIEGTFEEWGEMPPDKGRNKMMAELLEMIRAGYSDAEIIMRNPDYIAFLEKIGRARTTLLIEKYKGTRRLDLTVIYVFGPTQTGKSRMVLDCHGDENVYRVTDYQHPFDHYSPTQSVLCFEEFRNSLSISSMLEYTDIYPLQLPARYANNFACYTTVYIISNWPLEEQYKDVQVSSPDTWKAFLRRIHRVMVFNKDGSKTEYDSVKSYMERKQQFHPVNDDMVIPFEEEKKMSEHDKEEM